MTVLLFWAGCCALLVSFKKITSHARIAHEGREDKSISAARESSVLGLHSAPTSPVSPGGQLKAEWLVTTKERPARLEKALSGAPSVQPWALARGAKGSPQPSKRRRSVSTDVHQQAWQRVDTWSQGSCAVSVGPISCHRSLTATAPQGGGDQGRSASTWSPATR